MIGWSWINMYPYLCLYRLKLYKASWFTGWLGVLLLCYEENGEREAGEAKTQGGKGESGEREGREGKIMV